MKTNIDTIREALNSEFKDSQWVAYEASDGDTETFETYDQAKAWLDGFNDDGISEETEQGYSYIARITHRTAMEITDRKENYHQHTDSCGALTDECDEETWPYDDEYDHVGSVDMIALAALSTIDPEEKPQEPSDDAVLEARRFAEEIASLYISWGVSDYYKKAAALITAHDDAIRRECADRAIHYIDNNVEAYKYRVEEFRAAILGTEPAREGS